MYKTNKQNTYIILFILISLYSLNKIIFLSTGMIENIISYITYPVLILNNQIIQPIKSFSSKITDIKELQEKLDKEIKERENLMEENIMLKASFSHLEQVMDFLEFKKKYELNNSLNAQIIMKDITSNGHYFYLDKGSNSGVVKDMIAIYKNCLVGRVIQVYPTKSRAIFITDNSCKVSAFSFKTGAMGIYEGINQTKKAQLSFVSHLDSLMLDDIIISSGEGLIYPKGLALGKIADFKKANEIQYETVIKPLIDIKNINYCRLIKK